MEILLISSYEPWTLGLSYLRAFRKLGYNTLCFDVTEEYEKVSRLTKNRYTNRLISPYAVWILNKKLIEMANDYKPDLIFIHKGQFIYPKTLEEIKTGNKALLFIFNPDDPFNTNRGASSKFIRNSVPLYDCYFIWSKALIPKVKHAGAKRVEYLPFASDPELHYPTELMEEDRKKYESDIVFVGNWDVEREEWLSRLDGYNLAIWGTDYWRKRCKNKFLKSCWEGRTVFGGEMSKVLQCSKINLNILRLQNKEAHNMRTFEVPACGGFMLHERSHEVLEIFKEDEEIACFSTPEELREKIEYYLVHEDKRRETAERAYQKVQKETYLKRAQHILEVYKSMRKSR